MIPILINFFVTVLVADGSACQSMHTCESSITADYEVYCSCPDDANICYWRLGYRLLVWKTKSLQYSSGKVESVEKKKKKH